MVSQLLYNMIFHLEASADITDSEDWGNTRAAILIIDKQLLIELETLSWRHDDS